MTDEQIIKLYWDRDEDAIPATSAKYGAYCGSIARNILSDPLDAEECVNDTYLNAWNAIPPHRPRTLSTFLGRLTRNLAFNRYNHNTAVKRGGGQIPLVLEELSQCLPGGQDAEQVLELRELARAIDQFLGTLPQQKRQFFVCRYWYSDSISAIAARFGKKESTVAMSLSRTRAALRRYLTERGLEP